MLSRVDLPDPDCPSSATKSPASTSSEIWRRTSVRALPEPYALSTSRSSMIRSGGTRPRTLAHESVGVFADEHVAARRARRTDHLDAALLAAVDEKLGRHLLHRPTVPVIEA